MKRQGHRASTAPSAAPLDGRRRALGHVRALFERIGKVDAVVVAAGAVHFGPLAAIELPRGLRINVVNPSALEESMAAYGPYFVGFEPVLAQRVALAYARSVDGLQSGRSYRAW